MIKSLRRKFIITNMLLVMIVMFAAYTVLYFSSEQELEEKSISAMRDISNRQSNINDLFQPKDKRESKYSYLTTYTIEYNAQENAYYIDGFSTTKQLRDDEKQYLNNLIRAVYDSKQDEGVLKEYNMRFLFTDTPTGHRIVLLDKEYEDDSLNQLIVSFLISGAIAFVAFLVISIVISGYIVKPIEKSLTQQKQLISDVSHELKTPITVISSNTDLVLSHMDSTVAEERKWLEYICDEAKRMTELVHTMLFLARSDEAREKPTLKEVNFSNLAYEVVLPFESICYENNKKFDISIQPDIIICADDAAIKQLIVILLDNAVKYSNEGGTIIFKLETAADKAVMSVFNTGDAIPKESLPLIFDRFYRVDKARSRDKGASGLGLSIAKQIIENNEGSISVTSIPEIGTTFTCSFNVLKHKKREKQISDLT